MRSPSKGSRRPVRAIFLGLAAFLGFLLAALCAAFLLAQTSVGKAWIAREAGRLASRPGVAVTIEGLYGLLPFRMTAKRVVIGDGKGTWLRISGLTVDLSARALFFGRGRIRRLAAKELRIARLPVSSGHKSGRFAAPVVPIALRVDRFEVARLILGAPVFGERVAATLSGDAALHGRRAQAAFDLHRTDGVPGGLRLSLALSARFLSLHLKAQEPTGMLADRLFARSDHLPLALSLDGAGPIGDWRGRLLASLGGVAHLSAHISLSLAARTTLSVAGEGSFARLLPPKIAPLLGERVRFRLVGAMLGSRITVDRFAIDGAAGEITGKGGFASQQRELRAEVTASVPKLSAIGRLVGLPIDGRMSLRAKLEGAFSGAGKKKGIAIAAKGLLRDLSLQRGSLQKGSLSKGENLPAGLSGPLAWSFSARASEDGKSLDVTRFLASGLGLEVTGSGRLASQGRLVSARLRVSAPDLAKFSSFARRPLGGRVRFDAQVEKQGAGALTIALKGSGSRLETGVAALDSLLGGGFELAGAAEREASGALRLDRLTIAAADADLSASGALDAHSQLNASLRLSLPRLAPLGSALGMPLAGAVAGRARLAGPLDRIALDSEWTGTKLAFGRVNLDRIAIQGRVGDLSKPAVEIRGDWSKGRLRGTLGFVAKPLPGNRLALDDLRLGAPGSTVSGHLELALASGGIEGRIEAKAADLKPWSAVFGRPLEGRLAGQAVLASGRGEEVRVHARGDGLGAGSLRIGRLSLDGEFHDVFAAPRGKARLDLGALRWGRAEFSSLSFSLASRRAGDFAVEGAAKGTAAAFSFSGRIRLAKEGQELRLTRLDGRFEKTPLRLLRPVALTRRGAGFALEGLDLRFGPGRIEGSGAVRGDRLSLRLKAENLSLAPLAGIAGYGALAGTASLEARLEGSFAAPQGHALLRVDGLKARVAGERLPALALRLEGDWQRKRVDFNGRLDGPQKDHVTFQGSLPVLLSRAPFSLSVPRRGLLRASLKGAGDLAHLEGLLPLGEGRVSGAYAVDLAVSGTLAQPLASGRVSLAHGRYENFATGALLTDLKADLEGDRQRLDLRSFTAGDGGKGRISASGAISFAGAAPRVGLSATLTDFRVAAREEATATASGKVRIEGPLSAPKITADLVSERVELRVPKALPPSVTRIKVIVVGGKTGKGAPPGKEAAPIVPATLDLKLSLPGHVFVRGRGLDSEWRGRLRITGTTAAPRLGGSLAVIRGNFSFLGKTFRIERGTISFAGGLETDPILDVSATARAADIAANVRIEGPISAPRITLSSTPSLPQDEVLSRLLFNQGLGQINAAQGLELAQTAATLAGQGPDVLSRLRGRLGLDWLRVGQSAGADRILNPTATPTSGTGGPAVSGGKYIGEGISIGVTQGLSPPTSKITVGIDLRPHLSVETELGSHEGGSGVGLYYKYNY